MTTRDKGIDVALWILCVDCLLLIVWNSLGSPPSAFTLPFADKILHTTSYMTLTFLLLLAAVWRPGKEQRDIVKGGLTVVCFVALFGISIEFAQGLVFERTADAFDALANITGIGLAWTAWWLLRRTSLVKR